MIIKDNTVKFSNLSPQLLLALIIVDGVMTKLGHEAVITSCNDGVHGYTSLHYSGNGIDLRAKHFTNPRDVLKACKDALGNSVDFDIILEDEGGTNEHFHLEAQTKRH